MKFIETPSQVLSIFGQKLMAMKKTIRVQPTPISLFPEQRLGAYQKVEKGIQSGRPSTIEVGNTKGRKREHNLWR